jgi:hypothetical protein
MKKSGFSESQIVIILKEAEAGISLEELVRQHGFSKASFYNSCPFLEVSSPRRLSFFPTLAIHNQFPKLPNKMHVHLVKFM